MEWRFTMMMKLKTKNDGQDQMLSPTWRTKY
jgi:hypothetical protein